MAITKVLEHTSAFAGVDAAIIGRMAEHAAERTLSRGELVWRAGDSPQSFTLIRSGLVKLIRAPGRGRSSIWGLFGPHETIGDIDLLKGTPYASDAVVGTDSATLITVPRQVLLDEALVAPKLGLSLACAAHESLTALQDKIDVLSAGSVEARLATLLLKLYEKFGDDFEDGTSRIPVVLTRRELADLVSTSFETAIRVMTRWERDAVVSTEPGGFVLRNLVALESASGTSLSVHAAAE
jgi:CRP/FNR family transcriptional regulator